MRAVVAGEAMIPGGWRVEKTYPNGSRRLVNDRGELTIQHPDDLSRELGTLEPEDRLLERIHQALKRWEEP